ncbi:hypothetical protein [Streptomyces diastatochromogenes]|uniref:Secreted protein n=1 Tax=Streptomyces diastatochromogenes TaxID=42236 RepID=A0A233RXM9_STRDA|nr:hypothetical protein [Streptomyces diastatochromogenes]MCZ0986271.1 hypothetical protein [Streptomyces diastatochromogenes]OXY88148.1 hypothetical protein BEK98_42535 [Streptomyces diastatochromogenes]
MFRGTTARTLLALLTAALLALQFFAPTGTFAPAHTLSHAKAKAAPETARLTKPVRKGMGTFREGGCSQQPVGDQHLRDRQRGSASGWAQERPLIARQAAAPHTPAASGAPHHRTTRSSRAHSPAALQVFRC